MANGDRPAGLVSGSVTRLWRGPLAVVGDLLLTPTHVRFTPSGPLKRLLHRHAFDLILSEVREVRWVGRRRLCLACVGEEVLLEGSLTAKLAACLLAMRPVDSRDDETSASPGAVWADLLQLGQATFVDGPVYHRGWLALSALGLRFEYSGLVEHAAGLRGWTIPLARLAGASLDDGLLTSHDGDVSRQVKVGDPDVWFECLAEHAAHQRLPWDAEVADPDVDEDDAPLAVFDGVLQIVAPDQLLRGRATFFRDAGLVFVGLDGQTAVVGPAAIQQAVFGRMSTDQANCLKTVDADGQTVVLRPRGGARAVATLRSLALGLPMVESVSLGDLGLLRRLRGHVDFARITSNHRDAVGFRPGWIVQAPDSVGLAMPDASDWAPPVGTRVRLVVGVKRGVIEVDGRVLRQRLVESADLGSRWHGGDNPVPVLFLVVPHADDVSFQRTRRDGYRVPTSEPLVLRPVRRLRPGRVVATAPDVHARMVNLSLGGCAVLMSDKLSIGLPVEVEVTFQGMQATLSAEVVHALPQRDDDEMLWRHGLRFEGLLAADHTALSREVQRRETSATRSDDPVVANRDSAERAPSEVTKI